MSQDCTSLKYLLINFFCICTCRSQVSPFTLWHPRLNSDHQVWWWAFSPSRHLPSLRLCLKPQFSFLLLFLLFYFLSLYNVLWDSVPSLSSYFPPTTPVDCHSLSLFVCLFSHWKLKLWILGVGIHYALCHWRFSVRQRRNWQVGGWKTARVSVFILKQSEVERPFCVLRAIDSSNREDGQQPKLSAHCSATGIDRHIMTFPLASPVLSVTLK